jgi:hypothetical protein
MQYLNADETGIIIKLNVIIVSDNKGKEYLFSMRQYFVFSYLHADPNYMLECKELMSALWKHRDEKRYVN